MALNLSKDFTFAPNTVISSSEVNTDMDEIYNAFTGLEAGTSSMSKLPLDTDPTSALYAATKQYVDAYANYRRPNLTWISVTQVDIQDNTGTANQTKIIFPDGNYRSVTEDTASTNKYRRFDITATAEFTSGTEDSGLRSGISETNNLWYAIYAVKSLINTANFVLAGDTTLPLQANFSTLNGRYGTNGWVYIGMIKNGDSAGAASSILSFITSGMVTVFTNTATGSAKNCPGTQLASSAGANNLTYTYSAGTGSTDIPNHLKIVKYFASANNIVGSCINLTDSGATRTYDSADDANTNSSVSAWMSAAEGAKIDHVQAGNVAMDLLLTGFMDSVLGIGPNPLI